MGDAPGDNTLVRRVAVQRDKRALAQLMERHVPKVTGDLCRRFRHQLPPPDIDEAVNRAAFEKVTADKTREANDGFDGSWVAHPGMVATCLEVFDGVLGERPNQVDNLREDVSITAADLLDVRSTPGEVT